MSYLEHKKGLIVFLTILFAAGGYFLFFNGKEPETTYKKDVVIAQNQQKQLQEKDTDGDGLKDWEEILWKTDPNNPDSDGDGIKDGNEAKEKLNPLMVDFSEEEKKNCGRSPQKNHGRATNTHRKARQ